MRKPLCYNRARNKPIAFSDSYIRKLVFIRQKKRFEDLEFSDGFLFAATLEDEELCRLVLERILEMPIKRVRVQKESVVSVNPEYCGIRMDVFADDEEGTLYDIEMQTTSKGNLPKRSRFYQSQMDVASLELGDDFNKLPQSFIIFICTFDPFGRGRYRYTYQSLCKEEDIPLEDGAWRVFLNTRGTNEESAPHQLVDFLHFVEKSSLAEMEGSAPLLDRLQKRIEFLKRNKKLEDRYMRFGEMLDDERREGREEGLKEGCEKGLEKGIALMQAMLAGGKMEEITRLQEDPQFLEEMLEYYHIEESFHHAEPCIQRNETETKEHILKEAGRLPIGFLSNLSYFIDESVEYSNMKK